MSAIIKRSKKGKTPSPSAASSRKPIEVPDSMWERVSRKAYELWEQRGRQDGHALRDWLEAEGIVMGEVREVHK